jgi:GPH family glycoside/pentoside/hexuronide:cation symporter
MKQSIEKLNFWTKFAYGSGDLGTAIVAALKAFFLLIFLTDVARLNPAAAGSIVLITKLWDAINDPLIGWLSDHTHSRWGRRRPWLIFGALPFGLLFFMMWIVPPFDDVGKFLYYLIVGLLMDTAYTVINVPYTALTPELTHDYDERTSLNSFRAGFSVIGSVLAAGLHPLIVGQFDDVRVGYIASAAFWAILCTIPTLVVFFAIRERPESMESTGSALQTSILVQMRVALANRPYRFVIAIYLCSWLALQLTATVMAYYMTYYMQRRDLLPVVLVSIQLSSFVFIFVWSALSHKLDKRLVYLIGASIWLLVQMLLFFLTPSQIGLMIPLAILSGVGVSTAYLVPWSMLPDVIEIDEWETGERREGIFYGLMVFLQKTGIALAIWLVGVMLAFAGYITPSEAVPVPVQPETAIFTMRMFIGPAPALILACSLVIAFFYPLSRRRHAEMLAALERRRITRTATRPRPATSYPAP